VAWFATGRDEVFRDVCSNFPGVHGGNVQSVLVL